MYTFYTLWVTVELIMDFYFHPMNCTFANCHSNVTVVLCHNVLGEMFRSKELLSVGNTFFTL